MIATEKDKTFAFWEKLTMRERDKIAKKYGYKSHRTFDAWVRKKEVGRLRLLTLILRKELIL